MRLCLPVILTVMGLSFLAGCGEGDPVGPVDTTPKINPDGLLWSNSGWKGVTAVDLKLDTIYNVELEQVVSVTSLAVSAGSAFIGFRSGEVTKVDVLTRQAVGTNLLSSDSGMISGLAADAQNLWVVDSKNSRVPKILKVSPATLVLITSTPVQADTCNVGSMRISNGELWLYHTNPPTLARVNAATGAIDASIGLAEEIGGMAEFRCEGGTGWVLSQSGKLVKIDLSTQTITQSTELAALFGANLTIAVSSSGVFVAPKGVSPFGVYKLSADLSSAEATFYATDTSLTGATLGFLEARGSRLVAVVTRGWYNQYAEIDVSTMTLMRGIGETYCYGFVIGE